MLTPALRHRYRRQISLPEIGLRGQEKIMAANIAVVGAGGLGSAVAYYLVGAGIRSLSLFDHDSIDETNLHRQILYGTKDIGKLKVDCARERLNDFNPHVEMRAIPKKITPENSAELLAEHDLIIDACDHMPTRYAINDACILLQTPLVYGAVFGFEGQIITLKPGHPESACVRCMYPETANVHGGKIRSCSEQGVMGYVPGFLGSWMASEAIKILTGVGSPLWGQLYLFDMRDPHFRSLRMNKDRGCRCC